MRPVIAMRLSRFLWSYSRASDCIRKFMVRYIVNNEGNFEPDGDGNLGCDMIECD